jgi:hypothetical protein
MGTVYSEQEFGYALVSAVPLPEADATGIGIVYKARDRSIVETECLAVEGEGTLEATYDAVMRVLKRARAQRTRRVTIYVDEPAVIDQLMGRCRAPRELLSKNLQTRGMLHQLGAVRLVAAQSPRFSARSLAESARVERGSSEPGRARQLTLPPEDAPA